MAHLVPARSSRPPVTVDRFERSSVDRFERRRNELADATLATLGELGYARTSLREISQKTAFSHGVLHYYFRDKNELITYCVRRYKEHCVTRYDELVEGSTTARELGEGMADALVATLVQDLDMHRLWYDLRTQAMFEPALAPTVRDLDTQLEAMIWRVVARYGELAGTVPSLDRTTTYALFDGIFENALVRHLAGDPAAADRLRRGAVELMSRLTA